MASSELILGLTRGIAWRHYYALTKPKVVLLILFTALCGMLLSQPGALPLVPLLSGLAGIGLAAAAGAVFNHVVDQKIDAVMARTRNRPIPRGDMDSRHALLFGGLLSLLALAILLLGTNPLTAMLTLLAMTGYAVIYTLYLKRNTPQNIVWGGLAGAAPPLLGWSAMSGDVPLQAMLLMLIIFIWTPPHFWPLAIYRREEYRKAQIPMLPLVRGVAFTKVQILLYSVMLLAVSLLPFAIGMSGMIYLAGALILGLLFIYRATRLLFSDQEREAMRTFSFSIIYLSLLFALLLLDHYLLIFP